MNLLLAPFTIPLATLPDLTLKRGGHFYHCTPDGRWVETGEPADAEGRVTHWTPLKDGPELRTLISYGTGFECLGYFESFTTPSAGGGWRDIGSREADYPIDRGFGARGAREWTWEAPVTLAAGHRVVILKTSPKAPMTVRGIVNVRCGRTTPKGFVPEGFFKP
jgi:hypothetical protein